MANANPPGSPTIRTYARIIVHTWPAIDSRFGLNPPGRNIRIRPRAAAASVIYYVFMISAIVPPILDSRWSRAVRGPLFLYRDTVRFYNLHVLYIFVSAHTIRPHLHCSDVSLYNTLALLRNEISSRR